MFLFSTLEHSILYKVNIICCPLKSEKEIRMFPPFCPTSKLFHQYVAHLKWDALKENDPESNLCGSTAAASKQLTAFKRKLSLCKKLKQHVTKPQGQTAFDFKQSSLTFLPPWLMVQVWLSVLC